MNWKELTFCKYLVEGNCGLPVHKAPTLKLFYWPPSIRLISKQCIAFRRNSPLSQLDPQFSQSSHSDCIALAHLFSQFLDSPFGWWWCSWSKLFLHRWVRRKWGAMGLCSRMRSVRAKELMSKQFWNTGKPQKIKSMESRTKATIFLRIKRPE